MYIPPQSQGFDPFARGPNKLLDFCERLEVAEAIDTPVSKAKSNDNKKSSKSNKKGNYKKTVDAGLRFLVRSMKVRAGTGSLEEPGGSMYSVWNRSGSRISFAV